MKYLDFQAKTESSEEPTKKKKTKVKAESVTCSSCAKKFVKSSFYIQHYQSSHGGLPPEFVDKELFICEECPSIFIEKHTLHTHKYRAHNKKRRLLDNENTNSDSLKKSKKENIVHEPIESVAENEQKRKQSSPSIGESGENEIEENDDRGDIFLLKRNLGMAEGQKLGSAYSIRSSFNEEGFASIWAKVLGTSLINVCVF